MDAFRAFRFVIFSVILFFGIFLGEAGFSTESPSETLREKKKPEIWVVNPWIHYITSFIGGEEVSVYPLFSWEGTLTFSGKSSLPAGAIIIALDKEEAEKIPLGYELQNLRHLFRSIPTLQGKGNPMYLDPPTMSLLGQKVLVTLSSLFPEHYIYFQRNLAEFESRMESTVDMGRKMLRTVGIVNFAGSYAFWIRAAAIQEIRPSEDRMAQILQEEGKTLLFQTLEASLEKGHVVVTDESMPPEVQEMVGKQRNGIVLRFPSLAEEREDVFLFLYEQYLAILNRYNQLQRKTGAL
jgi:hypothetical protein